MEHAYTRKCRIPHACAGPSTLTPCTPVRALLLRGSRKQTDFQNPQSQTDSQNPQSQDHVGQRSAVHHV
eukprot:2366837-Rhodomonas_salina.3